MNLSDPAKPLRLSHEAVDALVASLLDACDDALPQGRRYVLGVAGIAGSGKSTLAARLVDAANKRRDGRPAVFIPMDGFHFPNQTLQRQGWLPRKGRPSPTMPTVTSRSWSDTATRSRPATTPCTTDTLTSRCRARRR